MSRPDDRDSFAHLTPQQRDAIVTTQGSLLVSAAAGSGKTMVLAERCAYLACDLPADQRCGVSELLVVTFTDAAAGEMRTRIGAAIRKRIEERPRDAYLREQLYLLDSASISTIHSFCKTIVQKWFPQAGIDPQAAVLSGDEAQLLRREVLDQLFGELYGREDGLGPAFRELVDQYGAGEDAQIAVVVLAVHDFINSLPDPESWLNNSVEQVDSANPAGLSARVDELQSRRLADELSRHIEFGRYAADTIRSAWPVAVSRAEAAEELVARLYDWRQRLIESPGAWEEIAAEIRSFCFDRLKSRPGKLPEAEKAEYENATALYKKVKDLFCRRLKDKLCRFTAAEYRDGLTRTAPFVRTLVDLVRELEQRYADAKSAQAALDFNDLQRRALRLLAEGGDSRRPSAIARQLQQQYRYVLVDEFQDVDPLQESILRLVSRELADPPLGNLFTVGDVKQSIYRFRLAEPRLFTDRSDEFSKPGALGRVIHLQENFRSRGPIVDAVNELFRRLMSGQFGGTEYDEQAELHAAAVYPDAGRGSALDRPAIELHLLEPVTQQTKANDEGNDDAGDGNDNDEELEGIEREAYLIARRIQSWMGLDGSLRRQVFEKSDTPGLLRPVNIEYRHIVILLRAVPHKAEPIAEVLRRMGIPVRLEVAEDQLDSTEFRDVYSLLQMLDNRQQDIPLAAVLRSPLLGDPLNESDLLRLRRAAASGPFHAATVAYSREGPDGDLRERLSMILARLDRYRARIQREPVADVLWDVYEQTGYLSFVAGLPDGARRQDQLVRLHELARQFGRFARQGLRRFLRFLDEMVEQGRSGTPAAAAASADDAVRIMTIHASKGLEFPVVILADLQKKFNLADTRGMALVGRGMGLALQVADPQRRIRYPTLLYQLACDRGVQESLSEELRVLYVALTRAREHLMLVGRYPPAQTEACRSLLGGDSVGVVRMQLESAGCPLDWLLPALGRMPADQVDWSRRPVDESLARIAVRAHERAETDGWRIPPAARPETKGALESLARLEPLAPDEPVRRGEPVDGIISSLSFEYPALELTTMPARAAVSDFKRTWDVDLDPEERPRRKSAKPLARPLFLAEGPSDQDAVGRGTAVHRYLQLLDLSRRCDADDLRWQQEKMVQGGRLSAADAAAVDLEDVLWFFGTDLGREIRRQPACVKREIPFVSRVPPQRLDPQVRARDHRDVVLVRGVVDLVLCRESELLIADYKTDDVAEGECEGRAAGYRPQLAHYTEALATAYNLPVTRQCLVFLRPRRILDLIPVQS